MKARVLVVDDEAIIRAWLVLAWEDAGYSAVEAASASEAIAIMETDKEIRVVVTDIQMPGTMDGIALARYVRERWPPTIIVIASAKIGLDPASIPEDCAFLPKPFETESWSAIVRGIEDKLSRAGT
jgi:CheY-like chemotaxis protein